MAKLLARTKIKTEIAIGFPMVLAVLLNVGFFNITGFIFAGNQVSGYGGINHAATKTGDNGQYRSELERNIEGYVVTGEDEKFKHAGDDKQKIVTASEQATEQGDPR